VAVSVGVSVCVSVGVAVGVSVCVSVGVEVGVSVCVSVGVEVGVSTGPATTLASWLQVVTSIVPSAVLACASGHGRWYVVPAAASEEWAHYK